MSAVDSYRLSRAQNSIADAVRKAALSEAMRLGLTAGPETAKLLVEAVRNALQTFQTALDCDVDLGLGDRRQMPPDLAGAVMSLCGWKEPPR